MCAKIGDPCKWCNSIGLPSNQIPEGTLKSTHPPKVRGNEGGPTLHLFESTALLWQQLNHIIPLSLWVPFGESNENQVWPPNQIRCKNGLADHHVAAAVLACLWMQLVLKRGVRTSAKLHDPFGCNQIPSANYVSCFPDSLLPMDCLVHLARPSVCLQQNLGWRVSTATQTTA